MARERTGTLALGLVGGLLGIVASIAAIREGGSMTLLGALALGCAVVGILGALLVRRWHVVGGLLMIAAAAGGVAAVTLIFVFPAIVLAIAGLVGLRRTRPAPAARRSTPL